MKKISTLFLAFSILTSYAYASEEKFPCEKIYSKRVNRLSKGLIIKDIGHLSFGTAGTTSLIGVGALAAIGSPVLLLASGPVIVADLVAIGVGNKMVNKLGKIAPVYELLSEATLTQEQAIAASKNAYMANELRVKEIELQKINNARATLEMPLLSIDEYLKDHPIKPFDSATASTFLTAVAQKLGHSYNDVRSAILSVQQNYNLCENPKKPMEYKQFLELVQQSL